MHAEGGYVMSRGDPAERTVWELISNQIHRTLTNTYNSHDAIALRSAPRRTKPASHVAATRCRASPP